jgi:hypothetical protein
MAEFKPMVKMMTDEPSVILKLKKGGKVASKGMKDDGHKPMAGANPFSAAEDGKSPKKPSMAERRKSMNPNLYAKGGKVAHKQMGGAMPMTPGMVPGASAPAPVPMQAMGRQELAGAPMRPMGRAAVGNMAPAQRAAREAMVRKALTGMKKGGSTADCAKLEKELKHHEALSMSKAHPMKKASGGAIDRDETKTTIESGAKKFAKTKMDTAKADRAHGTGEVKEGKPGGYKMGGTIEGNEGKFVNTKVNDGQKTDKAHGTGGIKESNAGGYAKGGTIDWANRPADTAKPGKTGGTTGGVKEGNGGGYKKGGSAKKAFATGGQVVDDGKAEKMPRKPISRPVANSLQSGTFKKGGKVKHFDEGGDASKGAYDKSIGPDEDDMEMARTIRGIPGRLIEGAKSLFGMSKDAGAGRGFVNPKSVTKTEKSVTVEPRKRGGKA